MSEPPTPNGPESDDDTVALDVEVVEDVHLPAPPVQAAPAPVASPVVGRSAPPRPAMRSTAPRPAPRADGASETKAGSDPKVPIAKSVRTAKAVPAKTGAARASQPSVPEVVLDPPPPSEVAAPQIAAMPIISLGAPSTEADSLVEVDATGVRRSSLPPPPADRPSLADIADEVTPLRTRAPADSLIQAIPSPRAPLESDPNHPRPSFEDEMPAPKNGKGTAESAAFVDAVAEPVSAPEILPDDFIDSEHPPAVGPVAASEASPEDRISENPPEVDPEDVEIHETESLQQGQAKPPPVRLNLPLPLYARGAELAAAVQTQQTGEAPGAKRTRYWWDEMFGDDFLRTMDRLTDSQVKTEVGFIEESLGVQKGGIILDLACGGGRHAVELAVRGYNVVGYDLSLAMLARAADEAQDKGQKLNFLHGDMRDMGFEEMFDGVYCWSTSFGYFDDEKNQLVAQKIHRALRSGGMLLLDVANRDFVTQRQPSLVWFEGEGCVCMDEMRVDFITSRLKVKRMVILEDGRTRELDYSIRLYTLHELGRMLHDVGFKVTEVSGLTATPGVFMGADSPRLIVLAEKA